MKQLVRSLTLGALCMVGSFVHAADRTDVGSVGGGLGASYGIIGASLDVKLVPNLYASFGLGAAGDDTGFNLGLRYYLLDSARLWRPRIVANYGTNGLISTQTCFFRDYNCTDEEYESFEGGSVGFGQTLAFGQSRRHGMEIDILYKTDDGGLEDRVEELEDEGYYVDEDANSKLFFSVGYRFFF